jgi:quercetin dioxygenase-like cupin family protein
MKFGFGAALVGAAFAIGVAAYAAETEHDKHIFVTEAQVAWKPAPPSLPRGGQVAVLFGDPAKAGPFVMRIRMPKGYRIGPHTHPKDEVVTVISGALHMGMGSPVDEARSRRLPAGSLAVMPTGVVHYAFANEDTVVQLNAEGPWAITYVNPADDPRRAGAN